MGILALVKLLAADDLILCFLSLLHFLCFLSKMERTAFHLAAEYGQLEVVEFLIRLGCSHSAKDKVWAQKHIQGR